MQCPTDGSTLVMTDRSGIEIDYCPQCRGVWLDRGELDKIIDRSVTAPQPQSYAPPTPQYGEQEQRFAPPAYEQPRYDDHRRDDRDDRSGRGRGRRRESWLSELFD